MWSKGLLGRLWARVHSRGIESSAASALGVFRLVAWALCSFVYLVNNLPSSPLLFEIGVITLLLVSALMAQGLLLRAMGDPRQVAGLAFAEAIALPAVLLPTGGLASPFVWYALNPLLVAAFYLPMGYIWGVVAAFLAAALGATWLSPLTRGQPLLMHSQVILIMVLVTLTTRVQARVLRRLESQSRQISVQSTALQRAYEALAVRGQALSALLQFQREAVACADHAALYGVLVRAVQRRFAPAWAGVMYVVSEPASETLPCPWLANEAACRLVSTDDGRAFDWAGAWVAAQAGAAAGNHPITSVGRHGCSAAPLLLDEEEVTALLGLVGLDEAQRTELEVWLEYARTLVARMSAAERTRFTLDYLSDVYQFVEGAGVSRQEGDLLELVTLYAKQLTRAEKAAYWEAAEGEPDVLRPVPSIIRGRREGILAEEFSAHVAEWWSSGDTLLAHLDRYHDGRSTWHTCYTVVRSSERRFGVLFVMSSRQFSHDLDVLRTMGFLGYLAGAMLERQRVEELHGRLLVAEEQSRIAAEIHDGVSQSLFSLVYGLQGAMGALENGRNDDARRTLRTLRDVAAGVSREIRASIFQLAGSETKGTFVRAIRSFLGDLGGLYLVSTDLKVTGSEDNLSPALRRAAYRIVREACSNAARHGRGTSIAVAMSLSPQQTVIEISDNGQGFDAPAALGLGLGLGPAPGSKLTAGARSGLGLLNMQQLAKSFNGSLVIDSAAGKGTRVVVRIPEHVIAVGEGGGTVEAAASR
jgi:signal transduction histidine kinase